ncbi:helix-turn-helix domain-containing protein [Microbacterium sp. SYP-A9085]|jgi:predicted ArsR family transcriptional regulator|nr:helix-turn-helix domain-containing protein [Microbacterium sp. SYP-A9085]
MARMATGIRASRREDVLRLLDESAQPQTVVALAERLGTHPNTVRLHLERLLADGLVERTVDDRGLPGRPAQLFGRVRQMDGTDSRRYRMLAEILVDALADQPEPTRAAEAAGRRWGRAEAERVSAENPVTGLFELLDRVGFGPRASEHPDTVDICHCPFLELAREQPDIVCSIHLGLMRGALQAWDADTSVARLERREHPDVCVAHLSSRVEVEESRLTA